MSWIFAYIGNTNTVQDGFRKIHGEHLYKYGGDNFYIAAGGNKNTCFAGTNNTNKKGFIVVGSGIDQSNPSFLNSKDWEASLENNFDVKKTDGHFVIVKWNNDIFEAVTDILGLRDIYLCRSEERIILSTKIEWFKNFTELEVDFSVFGSRWLLFNQISSESIFKGIRRITSGHKLIVNKSDLSITETKTEFMPREDSNINFDFFEKKLSGLTLFPLFDNKNLSLSLSGGMDSRVLLSFLLKNKSDNWDVHTFGPKDHPDRIIVERIVGDLKIKHKFLYLPLPSKDEIISDLKQYIGFSLVSQPASGIVQLNNYSYFFDKDYVIIDGGFGEIWRREFLNRLQFQGKKALKNLNASEIVKYLSVYRSNIFSVEIDKIMKEGCINQLERIISELPDFKEINIGNWLDLFALKIRLPNFYAHEQARLDNNILSYMPFSQHSLLNLLFSIPVKKRKNAGLFRHIVNNNNRKLTKYPLAKGDCTYPYGLSSIQSRLWSAIMRKTGKSYSDKRTVYFLNHISDFVLDTVHSRSVKEYSCYNYNYLKLISNEFYKGNQKYANELDWFLAFEVLRQIIYDS
ncbi:MAG: hypothetical protein GXO77_12070 [Calditrichaeota bacterium]|nr:hypothetical protein [Calditrichota bacterium]